MRADGAAAPGFCLCAACPQALFQIKGVLPAPDSFEGGVYRSLFHILHLGNLFGPDSSERGVSLSLLYIFIPYSVFRESIWS